jgi:hypothetical protein
VKQEYNSNISLGVETVLLVPTNETVFITHCSICDTLGKEDAFLEWLKIIKAGTKIRLMSNVPYLDLKHITLESLCTVCTNKAITRVIFEWVSTNGSENKA